MLRVSLERCIYNNIGEPSTFYVKPTLYESRRFGRPSIGLAFGLRLRSWVIEIVLQNTGRTIITRFFVPVYNFRVSTFTCRTKTYMNCTM